MSPGSQSDDGIMAGQILDCDVSVGDICLSSCTSHRIFLMLGRPQEAFGFETFLVTQVLCRDSKLCLLVFSLEKSL